MPENDVEDGSKLAPAKLPGNRSPNYPQADIGQALEMGQKIYKATSSGKHPIDDVNAAIALGYSSLNGTSKVKLSAVKKFGILVPSDDKFRISKDAIAIFQGFEYNHIDDDAKQAIHRLAFRPAIFKDIQKEYGEGEELPMDNLVLMFLRKRDYSVEAAIQILRSYKSTLKYVNEHAPLNGNHLETEEDYLDDQASVDSGQGMDLFSSPHDATDNRLSSRTTEDRPTKRNIPVVASFSKNDVPTSSIPSDSLKTLTIELPENRQAVLYIPSDYTYEDPESVKEHIELWGRLRKPRLKPAVEISSNTSRSGVWSTNDGDIPVVVTGIVGDMGNRRYVKIEGSDTGVPEDEINYA